MFRPFMRFMHPETAEKFLQSHFCEPNDKLHAWRSGVLHVFMSTYDILLLTCPVEAKLCEEIKKLQDCRHNGITTLKGEVTVCFTLHFGTIAQAKMCIHFSLAVD